MINLEKKSALVTGSAGFIGSHLVKKLLNQGWKVVGLDNLSNGNINNMNLFLCNKNFSFIEGDIRDLKLLNDVMKKIDYVFHEAALIEIEESIKDPLLYSSVNIDGTLKILWSSYKNNVKKVIFASSAAVYGEAKLLPTPETAELNPISPYGFTKKIGEEYCYLFKTLYGLNYTILRYFNTYGPGQDPSLPYIGVISKFISKILLEQNITIYGDGKQTRDFVYIDDLVNANILAVENINANNKVFNIGYGNFINLKHLSKLILNVCSKYGIKEVNVVYSDFQKREVYNHQSNINYAKKKLGYDPKYYLEKGIESTLKWQLGY